MSLDILIDGSLLCQQKRGGVTNIYRHLLPMVAAKDPSLRIGVAVQQTVLTGDAKMLESFLLTVPNVPSEKCKVQPDKKGDTETLSIDTDPQHPDWPLQRLQQCIDDEQQRIDRQQDSVKMQVNDTDTDDRRILRKELERKFRPEPQDWASHGHEYQGYFDAERRCGAHTVEIARTEILSGNW